MNIDFLAFWNEVAAIVTKFPGTEAGTSYGTPAFKVNKKLFVRLKEDGTTIVVYSDERDVWMKKKPAVFFITDHYANYPLMLIDLVKVNRKDLEALLMASWQIRAPDRLKKEMRK